MKTQIVHSQFINLVDKSKIEKAEEITQGTDIKSSRELLESMAGFRQSERVNETGPISALLAGFAWSSLAS